MLIDQFIDRTVFDLKRDRQALEEALKQAGCEHIRGSEVRCPFCEDNHPSAGIYETEGVIRYKCHACGFGGSIVDVISRADGFRAAVVAYRTAFRYGKARSWLMKWNTHNGPFWYSILQILYHRVPVGHLSGWYILLPSKFIAVRGERNQGLVETVWV